LIKRYGSFVGMMAVQFSAVIILFEKILRDWAGEADRCATWILGSH